MEFPNQDTIPSGGFGNLIVLPLQKQAVNKGNSVFVDEHFIPYRDQWAYLSTLTKIDEKTVDGLIEKLCAKSELGELYEERFDKPWEIKLPDNADDVFPQTHEIVLSNMLYIPKQGVSQSGLNKLKRLACFKNPEFYKAQAMFKDMSAAKMSVIIASAYIPSRQLNMLVRTAEELKLKGAVFEVVSKRSDSIYCTKLERLFSFHGIKHNFKNMLGHSFAVIDSKTVWYSSGELFGSDDENCVLRIEDEVLAGELAASVGGGAEVLYKP